MNIYKALRFFAGKVPGPMKLMALAAMLRLRRRMTGIFLDPVLACNLRCRMCYFSDPARRAEMRGNMTEEQLAEIEKALYPTALKVQIGCGAEPTLSPMLPRIVRGAKRHGVPNISLVTNGQLLAGDRIDLEKLVEEGLDELILSLHGTRKETYEYLMDGARWDNFRRLAAKIAQVKRSHPGFSLRVNFTVNSMNVDDLAGTRFWDIWEADALPDTVQLRPVQKIGESAWNDFDLTPIKEKYDETIGAVVAECRRRGITVIAPTRGQLDAVNDIQDAVSAEVEDLTYCYVSPTGCYKPDFDPAADTFAAYHRRKHTVRRLLAHALNPRSRRRNRTKKLNYKIS